MNADIFALLLKVSIILAVAAIIALLLRGSSAARRHFVWMVAMTSVIVLTALQLIVPPIVVPIAEHSRLAAIAHVASDGRNSPAIVATLVSPPATADLSRDGADANTAASAIPTIAIGAMRSPTASVVHTSSLRRATAKAALPDDNTSLSLSEAPRTRSSVASVKVPSSELPELATHQPNQIPSSPNLRAYFAQFGNAQFRTASLGLWLVGSIVLLIRLIAGHWQLRRITRSASPANQAMQMDLDRRAHLLDVESSVRLLVSAAVATPCTAGWQHPIILLPAAFTDWTHTRHNAVITHELAHIARADSLTQAVASVACALFWFHPGFWLAARRLRGESERAADDCVINSGMAPLDYADHLLAIAQSSSSRLRIPTVALAMARSSQLELRLRALLNQRQSRQVITRGAQRMLGVAVLTAVIPFAALQARVQQPRPQARPMVAAPVQVPVGPSAVIPPLMQPPGKPMLAVIPPRAPSTAPPLPSKQVPLVVPPRAPSTSPPLPSKEVSLVVPPRAPSTSPPLPSKQVPLVVPPSVPTTIPQLPSKTIAVGTPAVSGIAPPVVMQPRTIAPPRAAIVDTTYEMTIDSVPGDTLVINIPAGGNVTVHGWDLKTAKLKAEVGGKYWRETRVIFQRRETGIYFMAIPEIAGVVVTSRTSLGAEKYIVLRSPNTSMYVPTTIDNEFELWIPRRMHVKYTSPIGSFTTDGVEGNLDGSTKLGSLDISNASGKANLNTENGDVRISGSTLSGSVHTDCGAMTISNSGSKLGATTKFDPTPSKNPKYAGTIYIIDGIVSTEYCRLKPRTSAERGVDEGVPYGPLAIDAAPYGGRLNTRSGDITVGSSGGVLFAGTSNANIDIRRMSGDITAMGSHGNIDIQTINTNSAIHNIWVRGSAGTVTIELPDSIDATIDIEVSYTEEFLSKFKRGARILDNRSLPQTESASWVRVNADPLRKFVRSQGTLGKGTGRIYIRVTDGDVVIKPTRS